MAFNHAVLCMLGLFSILLRIESSTPVARRARLGQRAHGSEGCGSERLSVGAKPAVFTSPGYPGFYPANKTCSWRLVAAAGKRINITSNFINLEHSAGCVFDHLIIFDGDSELAQTLGRYCGITPVSVITSSNIALVKLESDRSYTGVGFELSYTETSSPTKTQQVTSPKYCNSTFLTSPGIFTSPNFPLPTDINTYCQYTLKAPEGKHVELVFNFFHLEQSTSCQFDNIVIYDGPNKESFLINSYCGHHQPPLIRSSERDLFLTYTTDSLYSGGGFNVSYQFVSAEQDPLRLTEGSDDCSKLIENEGSLSSPGYPGFYPNNKICIYVLRAPQNQFVQITFDDFKMEMSDRCAFDYLATYDGSSRETLASYEFCGEQVIPGTSFTSKGREYTLKFRSDHSVSDFGFLLNITFVSHTAKAACNLQCENEGVCVQQQLGPMCDCVPPHIGDRCQIAPSDCGSDPCLNGGTCQSHGDSYICFCPDGLKGDNCQFDDTEPLEFVGLIGDRTVSLRDDSILECSVNRGYAHIEWIFDDDIYLRKGSLENTRRSIRVFEGGVLHILGVGPLNTGKYTCVAIDGAERIEQVAYVTVDEPCEFEVTYKPANATETIGKRTHLLKCLAKEGTSSSGRLTYTWLKDNRQLPKTDSYRVLSNHFLQISDLDFADAAKYTCEIKDNKCAKRYTAFLTVVGKVNLNNICGRPTMSSPGRIQRTARIVGGLPALDGSYPWFALLFDTVEGRSFCGATIIDSRWIVTAAHCLGSHRHGTDTPIYSSHTTKIFVGTTNCRGDGGVAFSIDRAVIHEAYELIILDNDIALIRLKEVIEFTPTVQPICLESKSFNEDEFFRKHAAGYVAGCGLLKPKVSPARELREVKLPIQSRSVCQKSLRHDSVMTESMFCAGFSRASRGDACRGDSGGGFVVQSGERFVLVGIVSWGIGCDAEGQYGFYTHVGRFFNWIHKFID